MAVEEEVEAMEYPSLVLEVVHPVVVVVEVADRNVAE